ncbi:hypothetical protein SAMN04490193_1668 [Pseudomonas marginalis]|nr:hypothetical protein SAMN04490193_1668 [Pseudomonas marginalis]
MVWCDTLGSGTLIPKIIRVHPQLTLKSGKYWLLTELMVVRCLRSSSGVRISMLSTCLAQASEIFSSLPVLGEARKVCFSIEAGSRKFIQPYASEKS